MEIGAKNTENTGALWCELQICRWRESHRATLSHVKLEEDILSTGQIVSPNGGKTLETRNQEMSDKSRNRL